MTSDEFVLRHDQRRFARITIVAVCAVVGAVLATFSLLQVGQERSHREAQISAAVAREQADIACVKRWANATTERTNAILKRSAPRDNAQAAIFHAAAVGNRTALLHALQRYEAANRAYRQAQRQHPIPPAPQFTCRGVKPPKLYTPPPAPNLPVPRTTTRHARPRVVSRTVVRSVPRIVTRTVVRVVTVPPGHRHH